MHRIGKTLAILFLFSLLVACGAAKTPTTVYYVNSAQPDDSLDGLSPLNAKKTIMAAVNAAPAGARNILVAGGLYGGAVSGTPRPQVILPADVSLYGGYSADFSTRDPATNVTTIQDFSNSATTEPPDAALMLASATTSTTVVDGFTILGGVSGYNSGVRVQTGGSPTIQNNIIKGGTGLVSFAIYAASNAHPLVQFNTLDGGSGSTTSAGLSNKGPSIIENNAIYGGGGGTYSEAVTSDGSPTLRNNTIHGGTGGTYSWAMLTNGHPVVQNNVFMTRSGSGSICFFEQVSVTTASPESLENNDFLGCTIAYRDSEGGCPGNADGDSNIYTCAVSEVNALSDIPGGLGGNVSVDPLFADIDGLDNNINTMDDNDWHFSASSPASVKAGGLNGRDQSPAWAFTTDKDGVSRPASGSPWSIGEYEP